MDITELKALLRSLVEMELRQTQHDARSLLRCYHAMTGKRLPLAKHGYNDPVLFLREMFSDCFEFHGPEDNPVITLKLTTNVRFKEQRRSIPDHHQSVSDSAEENASMDRAELEELKTNIRNLVDELHPEGVWCSDLMVLYRQRYGQELDFKRFGYPDIEALALELDWHHEFREKRWRLKVRRLLSVECARPPTPPFDPDDALPGIPYVSPTVAVSTINF
ncbi:uncharacterized protein LOC114352499 [Ostrinia furnacalis]|uniref:uncharacterized protein LOC114352499 n=1 Tax=Ostrinia furnacalis TaxID=93504 RepID=UPI00103ED41B|nr:uncharacterized protein LOC114352499 [Ostrinia furnacalis]